jgi:hypothetical protein
MSRFENGLLNHEINDSSPNTNRVFPLSVFLSSHRQREFMSLAPESISPRLFDKREKARERDITAPFDPFKNACIAAGELNASNSPGYVHLRGVENSPLSPRGIS